MNVKKRYIVLLMLGALLLGAVGSYVGVQLAQVGDSRTNNTSTPDSGNNFAGLNPSQEESLINKFQEMGEISKVMQAFTTIQQNYVEDVEKQLLIEGAIQGMLSTLEDPYSVYMDKETMDDFNHQIESSFEGIGAEVSMKDGKVTIVAPIKDSPAEEAGLKPNDQILKVDEQSVEGLDLYEAVSIIRGEQGSKVTIEIQRPGVDDPITFELIRDNIPLETVYVDTQMKNGKKVGIIEITSFSENTADRFAEELTNLEKDNIEGLVIDVRGNPGGLLPSVENILKNFITKDLPYVQIEDRSGQKSRYFSDLEEKKDYPISVLIDEGSASASEILAIAMKEAEGYDVVGTTSFGKGTVQTTLSMGDGSTIKLTVAKWLSPKDTWIHENGVEPTVEVKQPDYFYANPIQIEEPLMQNQSNDNVKNAQIMLSGLGFDSGRDDGFFDEATVSAVESFQQENELSVTGEIDQKTAELLQAKIVEQIRSGEHDLQKEKAIEVLFQ